MTVQTDEMILTEGSPPSKEAISRQRELQMEALRRLRRKVARRGELRFGPVTVEISRELEGRMAGRA